MEISEGKIVRAKNRDEWRKWLSEHFETETEVWFVFPSLASGEEGVIYNDAVEEALCFGWIDSTIKNLDPLHRIQRFTPRRKGSPYSRPNIERLIWLESQNMIHPKIRSAVLPIIKAPYVFPKDILDEIRKDKDTWKNYQQFSPSYQRLRVSYINDARKRPEEFQKRLKNFISKTKEGKIIKGFGGVEKYYEDC